MILLTSFFHRDKLKDIFFRWMKNELVAEDCFSIKKIINFNVYIINLYLDRLSDEFFTHLHSTKPWCFEVTSKGKLKEIILNASPINNERVEYLRNRFIKYPGDFYYNTPFHGKVYCKGTMEHPLYLGHSRIKRFRRIAEKASRRIIEIIFNQIKKRADQLASERAARLGIPKDKLFTPLNEQVEEFTHAERRFIKELRSGLFVPDKETIESSSINDCAGIKAIIENEKQREIFESFFSSSGRYIKEKQVHTGVYNATNYIIEFSPDKEFLINNPPNERVVEVLSKRGIDPSLISSDYKDFVKTSEETVILEVITSNYLDMIESELGSCMHEERVLKQREQVEYKSSIARNVRYITEFLFLFAISGKNCLPELPIKIWEKTMPDTYDHAIRQLWDIPTMPVI